jgi:tol-pal system protein YbgF
MLALALAIAAPGVAQAQDISGRIDRLERDLQLLQRQVYRGDASPTGQAPMPSGGSANLSGDVATRLQSRITELEQIVTRLTGRVEESQYQVQQMDQNLKRFMEDVDFRLQQLEGTGEGSPTATQGAEPAQPAPSGGQGAGAGGLAPSAGTLGTLPANPPGEASGQSPALPGGAALPDGSPNDQYNYAFGLLREGAYDRAAAGFEAFIEQHPKHALTGNAQYWLGETHYVQGDFERAAVVFLEGYRGFPDSSKAPDNLLKLGLSMAQLNKAREACAAFTRISGEYPKASDAIQRRAKSEAERLGCGNL